MLFSCGSEAGDAEGTGRPVAVEVGVGDELPQPASRTTPNPVAQIRARCLLLMQLLHQDYASAYSTGQQLACGWGYRHMACGRGGDRHRLVELAYGENGGHDLPPNRESLPHLDRVTLLIDPQILRDLGDSRLCQRSLPGLGDARAANLRDVHDQRVVGCGRAVDLFGADSFQGSSRLRERLVLGQ